MLFRQREDNSKETYKGIDMGLFSKKKNNTESVEEESVYKWMTVDEALSYSKGVRRVSEESIVEAVNDLCEQVAYLKERQADTKLEYAQVTQYLSDIQRFEKLNDEERGEIADAARMVLSLDEERIRFQTGGRKMPNVMYHTLERYENDFPKVLDEIHKKEEYLNLVRDDMRNLEGEKGSIAYEKDHAIGKKAFLNKLSYGVICAAITVFIILLVLSDSTGKDFAVPFFITGVAAIVYIVYYVYSIGECNSSAKKSDYMMNRANSLLNKVKIKYVNTTGYLDYAYEKYGVNSYLELKALWEKYVHIREEEKRYMKNTQLLNSYTERMNAALKDVGVEKSEEWIRQPEVFLDRNEMADFKEAISRRRGKLRAELDYSVRSIDSVMNELETMKNKYKSYEGMINQICKKNNL